MSRQDIRAISDYIGTSAERFTAEYCQISGGRPVLAQGSDGRCIFWDGLCTIHPVKPAMCRKWPFIESVLVDVGNWRAMADSCPGMQKDAPDHLVLERVRAALRSFDEVREKQQPGRQGGE